MHPASVKPHTQAVNCERVKEVWPGTHCLCMCGYSTSLVDYYMPGCCLQNRFKMLTYFRVMEIVIIITTHAAYRMPLCQNWYVCMIYSLLCRDLCYC